MLAPKKVTGTASRQINVITHDDTLITVLDDSVQAGDAADCAAQHDLVSLIMGTVYKSPIQSRQRNTHTHTRYIYDINDDWELVPLQWCMKRIHNE